MRWLCAVVALVAMSGATAHAQVAGQPYQVPAGYEQYGAGTLIAYGGSNYVISGDGTMLLAADQAPVVTYVQPANQTYYIPSTYVVPNYYYPGYYPGYYRNGGYRYHHHHGW